MWVQEASDFTSVIKLNPSKEMGVLQICLFSPPPVVTEHQGLARYTVVPKKTIFASFISLSARDDHVMTF